MWRRYSKYLKPQFAVQKSTVGTSIGSKTNHLCVIIDSKL